MAVLTRSWPRMLRQLQIRHAVLVLILLAIALLGAIPNYISGEWTWTHEPKVAQIQQLRQLQKSGLSLPGWQIEEQHIGNIGSSRWSIQQMRTETSPSSSNTPEAFTLLLLPQLWHDRQPQVEWMDLNGFLGRIAADTNGNPLGWKTDSQRRIQFTVPPENENGSPIQVNARFLRGWNRSQTYAMLQWYAWSNGGSASPNQWFWADMWSQRHQGHRMPWVAVSVLIPIKPLGDIAPYQDFAASVGQLIHTQLLGTSLNSTDS